MELKKKYKNNITILILSLVLLLGILKTCKGSQDEASQNKSKLFKYERMHLTKHAKDRMKCRTITQDEIEYIVNNGIINHNKTEIHHDACSTKYAIEGKSLDGQAIRVVAAACNNVLNIITVIDTENNYDCE